MTYELKPEPKQNKVILRHPKVVEYVLLNCKAFRCTPDEFILKLINNIIFLSRFHRDIKKEKELKENE